MPVKFSTFTRRSLRGKLNGKPDPHSRADEFRRVGENLYRSSSGGVDYARFRQRGKEIRRSLRTTDRELVKRRLQEHIEKASKIDSKSGKMSLRELARWHDESLAQFAPKTVATRRSILKEFRETRPNGYAAQFQISFCQAAGDCALLNLAVEDQLDLLGMSQIRILANDLLDETAATGAPIPHLRAGELGLQHRAFITIARAPVGGAEGMRQSGRPLAEALLDLTGTETSTD